MKKSTYMFTLLLNILGGIIANLIFNLLNNTVFIYCQILYLIFDYPHKHYTFKYFEV